MTVMATLALTLWLLLWPDSAVAETATVAPDCATAPRVCLNSLTQMSTGALRKRSYHSQLKILEKKQRPENKQTYMLGYQSDALALYSRLDLPSFEPPASGYPVVVIAPGWISREQAQSWDFGVNGESSYSDIIDGFASRGFAVITAGYRGRGSVKGVPAQGMIYRDAWGNGSYVSPLFYAIDVLNLLAGLQSLEQVPWASWLPKGGILPSFDYEKVSLWGHSQGGDVGLTALAVAGHNPEFHQPLLAASLWSGNIPDRFTQANTFRAMASSTQAFMSGDGSWTGSGVGKNGELNPDFIFPWPAPWIGTLDIQSEDWTWQADQWSTATVAQALELTYLEMYQSLNRYVKNMTALTFDISTDGSGKSQVQHAPEVASIMPTLGGYNYAQFIDVPLALHISDRDYYSLPAWNHSLAERINSHQGRARVYIYPGNTHALKVSKHTWFSPQGTIEGAALAMDRDKALFMGLGLAN